MLRPVQKRSLSDAVFEQLREQIVRGAFQAGDSLPAERALCEALGVNRGAVREALKRLAQARLVSVQHGGASRVLDYRSSAGLELLSDLLVTEGGFDPKVVRSVIEMRSALAPDIARLAALRGGERVADLLEPIVERMRAAGEDNRTLQTLAMEFWSALVDGTDNVAYRLAYNSLRAIYDQCRELLTQVLAEELRDRAAYAAIAAAVRAGKPELAARRARALIERGERTVTAMLNQLEAAR